MKRILVNLVIVLCFVGIGAYCYSAGKAYKILLENLPFELEGQKHEGFEAMQVTIENQGPPVLLLEGDRMATSAVGKEHVMIIEILDEKDVAVETKRVPFSVNDLNADFSTNAAEIFVRGSIK